MIRHFKTLAGGIAIAAALVVWMAAQSKTAAPLVTLVRSTPKTYANQKAFPQNSAGVQVDKAANRITLGPGAMLTLQSGPESNMMSFLAGMSSSGLTNPEIRVPANAEVSFTVINVDDDMNHSFAITHQAPPYEAAFVPAAGTVATASLASHENEKSPYHAEVLTVKTGAAGSGYYVCTIRGHAKQGMYGKFVVQ